MQSDTELQYVSLPTKCLNLCQKSGRFDPECMLSWMEDKSYNSELRSR